MWVGPVPIANIRNRVHVLIADPVIARKVITDVIAATKWIIRDVHDTAVAMTRVLPTKLPVELFFRNIGELSQPWYFLPASFLATQFFYWQGIRCYAMSILRQCPYGARNFVLILILWALLLIMLMVLL